MVYLCDALKELQPIFEHLEDDQEMEKLILDVKVPCHKNLSLCYLKQGNYASCIEQCKETLEIQPHSVKILYRMGVAHMNMNNLVEAEKYLRQAFLLDPQEKQVMKALQRIEYINNSKFKKVEVKINDGGVTIGAIIKFFFFWPIIIMLWMYRKVFSDKSKTY